MSGTTLLPKDGRKFNEIVKVLRQAGVHDSAKDYVDLRKRIVSWYHKHVLTLDPQQDCAPAEETPLPSSAYRDTEWESQLDDQYLRDPCLSAVHLSSPLGYLGDA